MIVWREIFVVGGIFRLKLRKGGVEMRVGEWEDFIFNYVLN